MLCSLQSTFSSSPKSWRGVRGGEGAVPRLAPGGHPLLRGELLLPLLPGAGGTGATSGAPISVQRDPGRLRHAAGTVPHTHTCNRAGWVSAFPNFYRVGSPGLRQLRRRGVAGERPCTPAPPRASHPPSALAPPPRGDGLPPARKKGFCSLGNPSSLKWVCFFFRQEAEPRF